MKRRLRLKYHRLQYWLDRNREATMIGGALVAVFLMYAQMYFTR